MQSWRNVLMPLILIYTGIVIYLVMVVVFWVGVIYGALTGKALGDIGGPAFLGALFTSFGAGA